MARRCRARLGEVWLGMAGHGNRGGLGNDPNRPSREGSHPRPFGNTPARPEVPNRGHARTWGEQVRQGRSIPSCCPASSVGPVLVGGWWLGSCDPAPHLCAGRQRQGSGSGVWEGPVPCRVELGAGPWCRLWLWCHAAVESALIQAWMSLRRHPLARVPSGPRGIDGGKEPSLILRQIVVPAEAGQRADLPDPEDTVSDLIDGGVVGDEGQTSSTGGCSCHGFAPFGLGWATTMPDGATRTRPWPHGATRPPGQGTFSGTLRLSLVWPRVPTRPERALRGLV